jgi:hypothetical protein
MAFRPVYKPPVDQGPKVTFNGTNLRLLNPSLFANVSKLTGDPLQGRVTIPLNKLDPDLRDQLLEAIPLLAKMPEPGSIEEHNARNKAILDETARNAEIAAQQKALKDSGDEQLQIYRAAGLADTERNSRLLTEHIRGNSGIYCAVTVRAAVEGCRQNLDWVKVAPPAAAPAPAPEPTITLSDGSNQLPLGTIPQRHHTIAQLRDLDARERAARGRQQGTFSSKF